MRTNLIKSTLRGAALAAGLVAGLAAANTTPSAVPVGDAQLAGKVAHEVRMYARYSIWDDIKLRVDNGNVQLLGEVSQPYKKSDLGRIVAHVDGVVAVDNELRVAPLSPMDDQIRMQVARAIYRDPVLSRYGIQAVPPIHIIVNNGHVTLEGIVNNAMEKNVAGIRANTGLSFGPVTNNLQVEQDAARGNPRG